MSANWPWLVGAILISAALGTAETSAAETSNPSRPNVILILVDDLGWIDLGCYGADLHETPHIDRLAKAGVKFTQAYASAPVCSPTRAAILTGKSPARLNITTWRESSLTPPTDRAMLPPISEPNLSRNETSLAKVLRDAGYLTVHLGKWHLGDASHYPESHGFDVHKGGTHFGAPATHFFPYRGKVEDDFRYVPHLEWGRQGEYLADRLTDEAIEAMRRAGDQPFFLNLWHYSVHTPLNAPQSLIDAYEAKRRPEFKHQNAIYAAMVKNLDDNVGRMLSFLEESRLAEKTIVIFTSDNGGLQSVRREHFATNNSPLRSGKGSLYEGGLRIPLIVRWPGTIPAAAECAAPVISADLYPTIVDLAAARPYLSADGVIDGVSWIDILKSPTATLKRDALFWHYPHYYHHTLTTPVSAVRSGNWKLLQFYERETIELYDLAQDPAETTNLTERQPEMAAKLQQQLADWRRQVSAQLPRKNPAGNR